MLFFVFVIILVAGIVFLYHFDWDFEGFVGLFIGAVGVGVSIIIMMCNYIGVDGYVDQMDVRHETLVYQYENDIYDNDNDLGKRELMLDIQDWNEDLARHQANQDDFWVGIYVPNIYDQFEFIELEKGE